MDIVPGELGWRKSSFSGTSGCVEVAAADEVVWVRDSKDPTGPKLRFSAEEWRIFVLGVKSGDFER